MDRFFYVAVRKYGLHELLISALSQLVRECRSGGIHVRRVHMSILLTFLRATHEHCATFHKMQFMCSI